MLNNNGYIIKNLIENEYFLPSKKHYRGIERYDNWPLEKENDLISKELTELFSNFFEKHLYKYRYEYEIMTDIDLLKKYANHCNELGIDIIIMKIMSKKYPLIANSDLKEIEVLGFDCMATECESHLTGIYSYYNECDFYDESLFEPYLNIRKKVNSNGLLNTYEEVENFIEKRNELLKKGINLENYWEPVVVRLSIVEI